MRFETDGEVETIHRPHPAKEAKRYRVRAVPGHSGKDGVQNMTNTMQFRGYSARAEFDDEDGILLGRIAGIRDGEGFQADNVEDLRVAFRESVDVYLETCDRIGKDLRNPIRGA